MTRVFTKAETVVLEVGSRILPASMLRVLLEARRVTGLGGLGRGGQDSRGADRGFVHLLRVGGVEEKRCLGQAGIAEIRISSIVWEW